MASLGSWKRVDNTALDTRTDGYATGLVAYVLQATGDPRAKAPVDTSARLAAEESGPERPAGTRRRSTSSAIRRRTPRRFMSDAATAYAVLALTSAR